tara:strand:- start:595 stop:771 length:177 start_codon:yes stop_codon:yes gene_type:complete
MIGFKSPGEKTAKALTPTEEVLSQLFESIMNPPDWQENYEQTLFWALIFNTQNKIHRC